MKGRPQLGPIGSTTGHSQAQELQDVIPSVVRPITSDGKPRLAVVYQDELLMGKLCVSR